MQLILGITNDAKNVINKAIHSELILEIKLKKDTDVINPELILEGIFSSYNYAVINELNRKYFITNCEIMNNNVSKLSLETDVLETYKNLILNSEATYYREIREGDLFDGEIDISPEKNIRIIEAETSILSSDSVILTTLGAI